MSGNENKTLKQLLTEPCRVQKKKGYYSYEAFNNHVINSLTEIEKYGANYLNIPWKDAIDRMELDAERGDFQTKTFLLNARSSVVFATQENKKIAYLDQGLADLLTRTKRPKTFTVDRVTVEQCLILLPKTTTIMSLLLGVFDGSVFVLSYLPKNMGPCTILKLGKPIDTSSSMRLNEIDANAIQKNDDLMRACDFFARIIPNFLLWQQSMHNKGEEIIELDVPTRKMGFSKKTKQIIVPRVIGEGYKPKVIRNYEPTGTHASPRTHWRSGHWRQQPTGKRDNPEHKTIWIEPVLINP